MGDEPANFLIGDDTCSATATAPSRVRARAPFLPRIESTPGRQVPKSQPVGSRRRHLQAAQSLDAGLSSLAAAEASQRGRARQPVEPMGKAAVRVNTIETSLIRKV